MSGALRAPEIAESTSDAVLVDLFESVTLSCEATGNPQPSIQWFKDGAALDGEVSTTYVIESVDLSTRGTYYCTATNSEGTATSNPVLVNFNGIGHVLYVCIKFTLCLCDSYMQVVWCCIR